MNTAALPKINSIGPPPEIHADRIVADMLRHLATAHAGRLDDLLITARTSTDVNPKAQRKLADRLTRGGAGKVDLDPGKRGTYTITWINTIGWNPVSDAIIKVNDPIPAKPWLAWCGFRVVSAGKGAEHIRIEGCPLLFATHHVLSRLAQRGDVRTIKDLAAAFKAIMDAAYGLWKDDQPFPPAGRRVEVAKLGTALVLQRHRTRPEALVAITAVPIHG